MLKQLLGGAVLATALALPAQSPLTTIFASNNGGAAGWTMYFDLQVNAPLTFSQMDINTGDLASGSLDVYWTPTTYVGNDTNAGVWTLGGSGPLTGLGLDIPTPCTLTPFTLPAGTYGIAVVHNGVYPAYTNGDGTATPGSGTNQTYSTNELTFLGGASAGGGLGTAICCSPRVMNCNIHYSISGSGTVATRATYGAGCVARLASYYELFPTTPSIDLSNTSISMLNTGNSYLVYPGTPTFLAPSAAATNLNLADDSETTITLSGSMPVAGGTTTTLNVCSNGHISTASNGAAFDFSPTAAEFLAWPNTTWAVWRDMIPNATGNVWFEEVAGVAYVTWNNVIGYVGTAAGTVGSTFQFQFHVSSGHVDLVFQSMDTVSISGWAGGEGWLIGYSPGGASADPGNRDISATLAASFTLSTSDEPALALAASARPLAGTSINLVTSNIPSGSPFGAVLLGFSQFNPGIDLTSFGMPGCVQHNEGLATLLFIAPGVSHSTPFLVPNFLGVTLQVQSAVFCPQAGLTPVGAVSSNGISLGIGNL